MMPLVKDRVPSLVYSLTGGFEPGQIELSVIIPVFNQEAIINDVINKIALCVKSRFELIIIDDGSTDQSCNKITECVKRLSIHGNLVRANVYKNKFSKFETYCDSFGFNIALGRYCVEIQADMFIEDIGFDLRLISAIESNDAIALISGRGVEPLEPIISQYKTIIGAGRIDTKSIFRYLLIRIKAQVEFIRPLTKVRNNQREPKADVIVNQEFYKHPSKEDFLISGKSGRVGNELNSFLEDDFDKNVIFLGETVMRGPLAFRTDMFKKIGNLDKDSFFLGFDDHDFCARAMAKGYLVGYSPVNFISPPHLGSTRKKRSLLTEYLMFANILRIKKNYLKSQLNNPVMYDLIKKAKPQVITFTS